MKYTTIEVQRQKESVIVSLDRPDVHNAMNEPMMKELTHFFRSFSTDDTVRAIVITGKGKSFCAGADLHWMKSMVKYSKEENIKDSRLLQDLYESIYDSPKITIAKINGAAFGGGLGLFAACDIALAVPGCTFSFSEVKLGIIPSVISTYILRRIYSTAHVKRLFITGERFSSEYAEKIGLIDFVIPENELDEYIQKYISIIRSSGPKAVSEVKNLLNTYEKLPIDTYKEYTVTKISELRVSDEGQEGITAFLEKRKVRWSE